MAAGWSLRTPPESGPRSPGLCPRGKRWWTVVPGVRFAGTGDRSFSLRPGHRADYDSLVTELLRLGKLPLRIVHLWSVIPERKDLLYGDLLDQSLDLSFYSLLFLAQAIGALDVPGMIRLAVVFERDATGCRGCCPEPGEGRTLGAVESDSQGVRRHQVLCDRSGFVREKANGRPGRSWRKFPRQ